MPPFVLLATVFVTGACALVIEISGMRVLSPYFGNTIYTTTSVISVFLLALSFGYYYGGRIADKHPDVQKMYSIIYISGISVIAVKLAGEFVLPAFSAALSFSTGPLISSIFLFLIPGLLLGTISPFAIRLLQDIQPKTGVGTISGSVFFWSTCGSILGSVITGFYLIPSFGISNITIGTGIVLIFVGLLPKVIINAKNKRPRKRLTGLLILIAFFLSIAHVFITQTDPNLLYQTEGLYDTLSVKNGTIRGRPVRLLFNSYDTQGGIYLDTESPNQHVSPYTSFGDIYKEIDPEIGNVLVIGGGAYVIPNTLINTNESVRVDVVEIEPKLPDISKEYFKLAESNRLQTFIDDGRRHILTSEVKYDFIFLDAYSAHLSVPTHMITKEFFASTKDRLTPGGFVAANVIGNLKTTDESLMYSAMRTFSSIFTQSYFFAAEDPSSDAIQNIIFVGFNDETKIPGNWGTYSEKQIKVSEEMLRNYGLLTDDYAPVDYLISKMMSG